MTKLPRQMLVAPPVARHALADPSSELEQRLTAEWSREDWAGKRVAVAVGSRGIDRIAEMAGTVVQWLRARGATPFIVPAMGSHGGATPEGQRGVLATYGVTEAAMLAPIEASMDVVEIGETATGVQIVVSAVALDADAVILINRVKPHTDFGSEVLGSGLLKMSAIGLGKAEGAFRCHRAASAHGHEAVIRAVSSVVLARLPRPYGIALVEDGAHQLSRIGLMGGAEISEREPELYALARSWMPALPLRNIDVLVVDQIGKNVSGAGMDTNIIGRGVDGRPMPGRRSEIRVIYARGITPASKGNAVGIGLADIVSASLVDQMDPVATYTNAVSALTPATARIPINFRTDAECMAAALRISAADLADVRIARIRHTLALDRIVLSEACLPLLSSDVEVLVPPTEWTFAADGNFDAATDLLGQALAPSP
jgi:Lactate racemase N-terminal domain